MVTPPRTTQPPAPPRSGCGSPRGRSHFWMIPTRPWGSRGRAPASLHAFLVSPVPLLPPGQGWAAVGRYLQPCCSRSPVPGPPLLSVASRNGLGGRVTRQAQAGVRRVSVWGGGSICVKCSPRNPGPPPGSSAPGREPWAAQLSKGPMRVPLGCGGMSGDPRLNPSPSAHQLGGRQARPPPSPSLFSASEGGTARP